MALSLKQAWEAIVTGRISAQNGGVSVDTQELIENDSAPQNTENIAPPKQSESSSLPTFGLSFSNPNPEIYPDENSITDEERIFAALSYFPFLSFFVIATRKDSRFALFHAWQGFSFFVFFVVSLPFYWLFSIFPLFPTLFWFFYLLLFGGGFFAAFTAWSGKYISFPIISSFSTKLSRS